ncbi:suppressor of tub2 mutation [Coemansia sp. RSA 552]|nr:suppressor of tub2 mutation [Coemansia sp. RSA 552]
MAETLDQLWRSLQSTQALGLEKRVAVLDKLRECLVQNVGGSVKALDAIIAVLAPTLGTSQVIACQAALGCIQPLTERIAREGAVQPLKSLLHLVLPQLLDRLGDGRMAVRELALSTLVAMWSELYALHGRKLSLERPDAPKTPGGARNGPTASSIPRMATPNGSRIPIPPASASPGSSQWSAVASFERDVQTQGFGHRTWRVREMVLEWLVACVDQFPSFPVARYIPKAFALLDDNQDAVRFASKRALNTIYHVRPEFQENIVTKAQSLNPYRPAILSAITAPKGDLAAAPSSPYGGMRSGSRLGHSQVSRPRSRIAGSRADSRIGSYSSAQLGRQASQARPLPPFVPSQQVPSDVKVHHVPSKQALAGEFLRTVGFFSGRESEENWVQRERAIKLYRGIVWGNAATELCEDLADQLREHIHQILQAVGSLRTSLSGYSMGLCDDIAMRLGPHASAIFDPIVDALLKQCAQTKKIGAQRAAKSLALAFQSFPLRPKNVEQLRLRISEKSAAMRLAVIAASTGIISSHGPYMDHANRRHQDVLVNICDIIRAGVTDAQPSVRESARKLFWELHAVSETHCTNMLSSLSEGVRASLVRDRSRSTCDAPQASPHSRSASSISMTRSPSGARSRPSGGRASLGSSCDSLTPGFMTMVTGHTPQKSPSTTQVSMANDSRAVLSVAEQGNVRSPAYSRPVCSLDPADEADEIGDDVACTPNTAEQRHARVEELKTPTKDRESLGLIDFSKMDIGASLLDTSRARDTHGSRATLGEQSPTAVKEDGASVAVGGLVSENQQGATDPPYESQATTVATIDDANADKSRASPQPSQANTPVTPQAAAPAPHSADANSGTATVPTTPRTQTARYWHGPLGSTPQMPAASARQSVAESPMPRETPQRLSKIDSYLAQLAQNTDVTEALFRGLARFAKEESSTVWLDTARGGRAYLDRILSACLDWLQNPAEGRDVVFTKDSCFDVLRVLVRRKSQYFSLGTARILLLEVLRNRFFESTILSGSAEDVFYDMATHLDADLCFALARDFFVRAPLPSAADLAAQKPGYAARLEVQEATPAELDPMGVFGMDNALAGVLEFCAEVVRQLPSSSIADTQELDAFMPYSVACIVHPRSQVRKAALEPIIATHKRLGSSDSEFEDLLLRADTDQSAAASANPLAKYIGQLQRPELRRLIWSFYQSTRDS